MKKRFVIYGLVGWCIEVFWTGLGSLFAHNVKLEGRTYMWMFFIYGLAIFLEPVHDRIRNLPVIIRGGVYTILIFLIEYSTGLFLRLVLGICPWDYSNSIYSISGLIRLDYAPAWFVAGLLFEKLHNLLMKITFLEESKV